ncbi:MAG: hypothetical protein LC641_09200 [Spirochaeta sp.]|nr:hypothetical protein [Spirochaeta sp.]
MSAKPKYNNQQEHVEDILKLSQGKRTSRRIGSRAVPHRLNREERMSFDRALKRGWLSCNGLRSALWNTYREFQHAHGIAAVIHEKTPYQDRLYCLFPPEWDANQRPVLPIPEFSWPVEQLDWGWCWNDVPRNDVPKAVHEILKRTMDAHHHLE